jgi:hypothetical protein
MSAGSSASNLGYGNITPFSSVNGNFVNKFSSNNPANFGSNEIPGPPGLAGAKNNVDAAAGIVPGICFTGGAKAFKRKIKNITKRYKKMAKSHKMKLGRKIKSLRKNLRSRMASVSASISASVAGGKRRRTRKSRRTRRVRRRQRGGYAQYQNNQPFYNSYSVGGILSANESALANPAPINKISNEAVDNYNHFTNRGFESRGH